MMTLETIAENVACLQKQLSRFIRTENGEAHFVNNADWLCKIGYIDMLREVGTIFSVNRMMAQESVKSRLEDGLTFLEFNYSILQAYDFMVLNRDLGCKLEMGGPGPVGQHGCGDGADPAQTRPGGSLHDHSAADGQQRREVRQDRRRKQRLGST